jgi:hypothetical protein
MLVATLVMHTAYCAVYLGVNGEKERTDWTEKYLGSGCSSCRC